MQIYLTTISVIARRTIRREYMPFFTRDSSERGRGFCSRLTVLKTWLDLFKCYFIHCFLSHINDLLQLAYVPKFRDIIRWSIHNANVYWKLKYFVINIWILITRVINNIFLWNLAILSQMYSQPSTRNLVRMRLDLPFLSYIVYRVTVFRDTVFIEIVGK